MVEAAAGRVTEYLLDRLGDQLRTVAIVRPDGYEVVYLDEALREQYTDAEYARGIETFRLDEPLLSPSIENLPLGERRAVVHYHESAFVLQIPFSETESILLSMVPEVGSSLLGFIETCRELVQEAA